MKKQKHETRDQKIERLIRELGVIGDCAPQYIRDFGEAGAQALYREKVEELSRLRAVRP